MKRPLWWDVPMPPAVAALPRTASGMPVVYITDYVDDGEDHASHVELRPGLKRYDCTCTFGIGKPKIGKQCPRRQADAVLNRKCGVCGVPFKYRQEMVFVGGSSGTDSMSGQQMYTTVEAGVHHDCATYSLLACPAMHGRDDVRLLLARDFELLVRLHTNAKNPDAYQIVPYEQIGRYPGGGVLSMFVMGFAASTAKVLDAAAWLKTAPPLTRPSLKAVMPERSTSR